MKPEYNEAVKRLNLFAEKLPPDDKKEVYEIAGAFLSIGATNGALVYNGIENDLNELESYLSNKAKF